MSFTIRQDWMLKIVSALVAESRERTVWAPSFAIEACPKIELDDPMSRGGNLRTTL